MLKINGLVAPLEFVELDDNGNHKTLWIYSPENGGAIVDAKFADLDKDQSLELIVIQKSDSLNNWLKIFEWNGFDFTLNQDPIPNNDNSSERVRPSNIANFNNLFSASISSPTRSAEVFNLSYADGQIEKSNSQLVSDPIVTNGYGPVFTGIFNSENGTYVSLLSPESNVLKVSVFLLSQGSTNAVSDVFSLNGARVLLGPDIQPFDEDKDGFYELLIPFATGEVFTLSASNNSLSFKESRLTESNLFNMKSAAGEEEINNIILSRVENGLYDSNNIINQRDDSIALIPTDSLMLGDTLSIFIAPDSASDFYEFQWSSEPPKGMTFDPKTQRLNWIPEREHVGIVDLSYLLTARMSEEIISEVSLYGNSHFLRPVLREVEGMKIVFVGDTIKPPEPFVVLPKRLHKIIISTKDIDNADRFTFEGETPFSSTSYSSNDIITVGVNTNLSTIKSDKSSSFVFQSSNEKPDSIVTVSIMHDLATNIIFTSIKPSADTLTQSFDAEGVNPDMYELPEYFFEGFPEAMGLDVTSDSSLNLLAASKNRSGILTIQSPLFAKTHDMVIEYFGGRPYAIRGDVNVKKDGSHKTLTEIDFDSFFSPVMIKSFLSSANRDTLVFHADSIPDTLKAKTTYKSFYSPVTIIKKAADESLKSAEDLIDSNKENSTEEKLQEPEAQESTDIIEASEVLNETPEPAEVPMDTLQTSTPEAAPADTAKTAEPAIENSDSEILNDTGEASEVLNETPEPAEVPMDTLQTSTPEAAPADTTGS